VVLENDGKYPSNDRVKNEHYYTE